MDKFIIEELKQYSNQAIPLKSGIFTRLFVKRVDINKLHPNPEDEFCMPEVGPSDRIIGEYVKKYTDAAKQGQTHSEEPITVEKMYPDGYMIMNGHHRWAAAKRMGVKRLPVRIVNLAHEADIENAIKKTDNTKRVTFDLDEVIFAGDSRPAEKGLAFPFNRIYRERLRAGVPGLFGYLIRNDYDIWLYSSEFYSIDYIGSYLKKYHVAATGIVTGTEKNNSINSEVRKRIAGRMADKYTETIHIDNNTLIRSSSNSKDFEEYEIGKDAGNWSSDIIELMGKLK